MPDVLGTLRAGRERIARGWCQGRYATDAHGGYASTGAANAEAWCISGAVRFCASGVVVVHALRKTLGSRQLAVWNDHPDRTQADVLDLFDRTIARVESEAGA